jgi:hypothetical protein
MLTSSGTEQIALRIARQAEGHAKFHATLMYAFHLANDHGKAQAEAARTMGFEEESLVFDVVIRHKSYGDYLRGVDQP